MNTTSKIQVVKRRQKRFPAAAGFGIYKPHLLLTHSGKLQAADVSFGRKTGDPIVALEVRQNTTNRTGNQYIMPSNISC